MKQKMEVDINASRILTGIRLPESKCNIASHKVSDNFQTVAFDQVKEKTLKDKQIMKLIH